MNEYVWQYSDHLEHHGIFGQKWGVRRFQNEDGTWTNAGKKRYDVSKDDEKLYGKRGAQRIAKRREKGDTHTKARLKEINRDIALGTLAIGALAGAAWLASDPERIGRIVDAGKRAYNDYQNVTIIGKDGNVITSYHDSIKVGKSVCDSFMHA